MVANLLVFSLDFKIPYNLFEDLPTQKSKFKNFPLSFLSLPFFAHFSLFYWILLIIKSHKYLKISIRVLREKNLQKSYKEIPVLFTEFLVFMICIVISSLIIFHDQQSNIKIS